MHHLARGIGYDGDQSALWVLNDGEPSNRRDVRRRDDDVAASSCTFFAVASTSVTVM